MDRGSAWMTSGGGIAPEILLDVCKLDVDRTVPVDLALLRAAFLVPQFITEWAARRLHLPQPVVGELLDQLREEQQLDVPGHAGPLGYRYSISGRGRERAARLLEMNSSVGRRRSRLRPMRRCSPASSGSSPR